MVNLFKYLFKKPYKNDQIDGIDINIKDTIPYVIPITGGRVIKVYDANIIMIASKLPIKNSPIYRFVVQLNNVYCPDRCGLYTPDSEKIIAIKARDFISNLLLNKYVTINQININKYSYLLVDMFLREVNISELLVEKHFAVKNSYEIPENWSRFCVNNI